jgi:hypothetical protein
MPVTARLSKAFYDRFGEQVANELVDWLAMDIIGFNRIAFLAFGSD